jgi:hypothetical protein
MTLHDVPETFWQWAYSEQDNITALGSLGIALVVAWCGWYQWQKEQRWKRVEHVLDRIRAFGETPGSINAMMMLGVEDREIALWDTSQAESRYVRTTPCEVATALLPHDCLAYIFSPKETAIRNSFDDFFGKLDQIEVMIDTGTLRFDEVDPIVGTWVRRYEAAEADTDSQLARSIRLFVEDRGHTRVQRLFARFCVDLGRKLDLDSPLLALPRPVIKRSRWLWRPLGFVCTSKPVAKELSPDLLEQRKAVEKEVAVDRWKRSKVGPDGKETEQLPCCEYHVRHPRSRSHLE